MLQERITDMEKILEVLDKLDTHYDFYLLKVGFTCRNSYIFPFFCKKIFFKYHRKLRTLLCKVTIVKLNNEQILHAILPAAKSGSGVISALLLGLPAFLFSAVRGKAMISEILIWSTRKDHLRRTRFLV